MTKRIYNTSPDKPVLIDHGGARFIFQPAQGEWKREAKKQVIELEHINPKTQQTFIQKRTHNVEEWVKVSDKKVRNWADVPNETAHFIATRADAHDGLLVAQSEMDKLADKEMSAKSADLKALKAELEKLQAEKAQAERELAETQAASKGKSGKG